jgi:hypothetical protein
MQLTVFKEVHYTWPSKNGKPAGESYDLLLHGQQQPGGALHGDALTA